MESDKINNNFNYLKLILTLSLILNVILIIYLSFKKINSPENRCGVLKNDVKVLFPKGENGNEMMTVIIPKGITVKDASPRGFDHVDLFEPYRFQIIFSSDEKDMIDYSVNKTMIHIPLYGYTMVK